MEPEIKKEHSASPLPDAIPADAACRICRGEATESEPLYYPCKCRGSIKYVHQDCLFQWLKHSKKSAICELCNTEYKLRKLYAPDMPNRVPLRVIATSMGKDILRFSGIGLKFWLVGLTWVVVLPFFCRLLLRIFTTIAECSPHQPANYLSIFDTISKAFTEAYSSTPEGISFPSMLQIETNSVIWKRINSDVLEGQLTILSCLTMVFQFFTIREWILQNDVFFKEMDLVMSEFRMNARFAMLRKICKPYPNDNLRFTTAFKPLEACIEEYLRHAGPKLNQLQRRAVSNQVYRSLLINRSHINGKINFTTLVLNTSQEILTQGDDGLYGASHDIRQYSTHPPNIGHLLRPHGINNGALNRDTNDNHSDSSGEEDVDQNINRNRDDRRWADAVPIAAFDENFGDEDAAIEEEMEDDLGGFLEFAGFRGPIKHLLSLIVGAYAIFALFLALLYFFPLLIGRTVVIGSWDLIKAYSGSIWGHSLVSSAFRQVAALIMPILPASAFEIATLIKEELFQNNVWESFPLRLGVSIVGAGLMCIAFDLYARSVMRSSGSVNEQNMYACELIISIALQARAVLKIVIIIGIELVAFPIFCGTLLHFSLLPIFENSSGMEVTKFIVRHIFISTLLHWAAGSAYMFFVAMFVSMCRKIIRPGVLYFVRDPNDPEFHPVMDILSRTLTHQLMKIGLSGIIYSFLITVCLGGVVRLFDRWGLSTFLPIKLMPPSEIRQRILVELPIPFVVILARIGGSISVLRVIWKFVFQVMAKRLRLSWFLLDKPDPTEQGTVYFGGGWPCLFPELFKVDYSHPVSYQEALEGNFTNVYFVNDGYLMRAPDNDRSIIRNGLFRAVTKDDELIDPLPTDEGEPAASALNDDSDQNENDQPSYKIVYRPPYFQLRIYTFLFAIWVVSAIISLWFTVVPVYLGREFLYHVTGSYLGDIASFLAGSIPVIALTAAADKWSEIKRAIGCVRAMGNNISRFAFCGTLLCLGFFYTILPLGVGYFYHMAVAVGSTEKERLFVSDPAAFLPEIVQHYGENDLKDLFTIGSGMFWWTVGFSLMFNSATMSIPHNIVKTYLEVTQNLDRQPFNHTQFWKVVVVPLTALISACCLLPFAVCWSFLQCNPEYNYARMFLLVMCYRSSVVVIILMGMLYFAKKYIEKWSRRVRDVTYLLGESLENVEG